MSLIQEYRPGVYSSGQCRQSPIIKELNIFQSNKERWQSGIVKILARLEEHLRQATAEDAQIIHSQVGL